MKTQNNVQLIGYLGADPVLQTAVNGRAYAKVRMATDDYWKQPDGTAVKKTTWHTIMIWNRLAESFPQTFIKGSHVMIQGSIRNHSFTGTDGGKRFFSHVEVFKVVDLDR